MVGYRDAPVPKRESNRPDDARPYAAIVTGYEMEVREGWSEERGWLLICSLFILHLTRAIIGDITMHAPLSP